MDGFLALSKAYKRAMAYARNSKKCQSNDNPLHPKTIITGDNNQEHKMKFENPTGHEPSNDQEDLQKDPTLNFTKVDQEVYRRYTLESSSSEDIVSEIELIDDFWKHINNIVYCLNIPDNKLWTDITRQWFFIYYSNNEYFQRCFWKFFGNMRYDDIKPEVCMGIIFPFLLEFAKNTYQDLFVEFKIDDILDQITEKSSANDDGKNLFKKTIHALKKINIKLWTNFEPFAVMVPLWRKMVYIPLMICSTYILMVVFIIYLFYKLGK